MTPTQAQIEAAALAIQNHIGADLDHCRGIAEAALERAFTAAAAVGEPNYKTWEQADRQDRNATIERCAQVANRMHPMSGCAAAIRALKDK